MRAYTWQQWPPSLLTSLWLTGYHGMAPPAVPDTEQHVLSAPAEGLSLCWLMELELLFVQPRVVSHAPLLARLPAARYTGMPKKLHWVSCSLEADNREQQQEEFGQLEADLRHLAALACPARCNALQLSPTLQLSSSPVHCAPSLQQRSCPCQPGSRTWP